MRVAAFLVFYGVGYALTAMESVYLGPLLPANVALDLFVNGGIRSAIFTLVLVWAFGRRGTQSGVTSPRLSYVRWGMGVENRGNRDRLDVTVHPICAVFYLPLAALLDPVGLAREQACQPAVVAPPVPDQYEGQSGHSSGVPAIIALGAGWRRTAMIIGLIFAVPMSANLLLPTGMSNGLLIAHFLEVFGENFVFGALVVWILHIGSRLPAISAI